MTRLLRWGPACAYMALIFLASSVPGDELPQHFWDKLVHFSVYAVLGVLFLIPLAEARLSQVTIGKAGMAVLLSTLYGAFDEVHQAFTPERTPDVRDLFADAFGAALGVVVILILGVIVKRLRRCEDAEG